MDVNIDGDNSALTIYFIAHAQHVLMMCSAEWSKCLILVQSSQIKLTSFALILNSDFLPLTCSYALLIGKYVKIYPAKS